MNTDDIVVYSTTWCPDCKRAKKFLGEQRIPYVNVDIEQDEEAMARVEALNGGKRIIPTTVVDIRQIGPYHCVTTADGREHDARAVLIATGAHYRRLGVPGEDQLLGSNIHFCATCDGAFYKGKKVLVVGGGNSGFEEGIFLTRFADRVDIVEFLPEVKASQFLQEQVNRKPQMAVITNHAVKSFKGEHRLEGIVVEDRATGETEEWAYDGVFVFIGLSPNSKLVANMVDVDRQSFVVTDQGLMTSVPGLFAAGDVRAGSTKQAASAAGEGATAALMIRDYLTKVG